MVPPRLDFAGVGAAKSGTSWIARCLAEHPEICMSEPKELNYFCTRAIWPAFDVNNSLGPGWLAQRFARCRPDQRLGEFSPNYLCDPSSPHLLHSHNPEIRLLFCFRNPVDAVVSYYHQVRRESPVPDTIEAFLEAYPTVRAMGFYHQHVIRFLGLFPREQCLFLLFEDLVRDSEALLRRCFEFLAVDPDFVPSQKDSRVNEAKEVRSQRALRAINKVRLLLQRCTGPGSRRLMWKFNAQRLHNWLLERNLKPLRQPEVRAATRQWLADVYRDDIDKLGQLLNRDLAAWQN